jgi:hypothetical protein
MHKSQQFQTCQQALRWHGLAQVLSERHQRHCLFYLGSVGSGRIGTDILSPIQGHLSRADLDLAVKLNALEKNCEKLAPLDRLNVLFGLMALRVNSGCRHH